MSIKDQTEAGFQSIQTYVDDGKEPDGDRIPQDNSTPGTFRVDGGKVSRQQAEEYVAYSNDSGHPEAVLSTLKNSYGGSQADLTNIDHHRCTVEVDGIRTSLATAIHLGYVVKDANGYHDGQPGQILTQQPDTPQQHITGPVSEAFNFMKAELGENNASALVASAIGGYINETVSGAELENTINSFSTQVGLEPEVGEAVIEKIVGEVGETLFNKTAQKFNLDASDLKGFFSKCDSSVKTSLMLRTLHGEPSVLHELASRMRYGNIR